MVVLPNSQLVFAGVGPSVRSYNPCCCIIPGIAPPFRCKQLIVVNLATAAWGSHKVDAAFSIQIKQTRKKLTGNFQTIWKEHRNVNLEVSGSSPQSNQGFCWQLFKLFQTHDSCWLVVTYYLLSMFHLCFSSKTHQHISASLKGKVSHEIWLAILFWPTSDD